MYCICRIENSVKVSYFCGLSYDLSPKFKEDTITFFTDAAEAKGNIEYIQTHKPEFIENSVLSVQLATLTPYRV